MNYNELKLMYVLKVGENFNGEGIYEFIFSSNDDFVPDEELGWNKRGKDVACPPDKEDIDLVVGFKTDYFKLICLHELNDRKYIDGYYRIHAIAYDDTDFENSYGIEYNDVLVFHYGDSFRDVENKLYKREIIFKNNEFAHANKIKLKKEIADQ